MARVHADGVLKKPFEATLLLAAIGRFTGAASKAPRDVPKNAGAPRSVVVIDPEQVRAAVTVALDAAMPAMVEEISSKVLSALTSGGRETPARVRKAEL